MSNTLLIDHKYKTLGWLLLIPSFALGIYTIYCKYEPNWLDGKMISIFPTFMGSEYFTLISVNFLNTIVGLLFILGGLLVALSKEPNEDEFIQEIRLNALLWAVLTNYVLLALAFILIYDTAFLDVMIYNMFTVLILFIGRFHYVLYKNNKLLNSAE